MKIFFAIITGLLLCLIAGANDPEQRRHYVYAFLGAVAGTIALFAIG